MEYGIRLGRALPPGGAWRTTDRVKTEASTKDRREQDPLKTFDRSRTALGFREKVGALQRRNNKAGDVIAFEVSRQLAGPHGRRQAIRNGVPHLREYLDEPMPDEFAVIARLRREVAE